VTSVPDIFSKKVVEVYGSRGKAWLDSLPDLIATCSVRWRCAVQAPFDVRGVNYVAPVNLSNGTEAVLKLCVPGKECEHEINVLRHYAGRAMCRLLESDASIGALLLERVGKGVDLRSIPDERARVKIAASLIKNMRLEPQSSSYPFPGLSERYSSLLNARSRLQGAGLFPSDIVDKVRDESARLMGTQNDTYVLHGDFHHQNILRFPDGWRLIDPKGVVGEVEYELIPFLMNELPDGDFGTVIDQRIVYFDEDLAIDIDRTYAWGLCHSLLSCWWNVEDHQDVTDRDIAIVRHFAEKV